MVTILAGGHVSELYSHWPIALAMSLGSYFLQVQPPWAEAQSVSRCWSCFRESPLAWGVILALPFSPSAWSVRVFSFGAKVFGFTEAFFDGPSWAPCWEPHGIGASWQSHALFMGSGNLFHFSGVAFGILHLQKISAMSLPSFERLVPHARTRWMGLLIGCLGGSTVASLTGVGIDMILYMVLVIYYRADLKTAIPTSVVLMAMTSVIGLFTQCAMGQLDSQIWGPLACRCTGRCRGCTLWRVGCVAHGARVLHSFGFPLMPVSVRLVFAA